MPPIEKTRSQDYRDGIRANVRGLWRGVLTRSQFEGNMEMLVKRGMAFAFAEGAKENGMTPQDYTDKEVLALQDIVDSEVAQISGFADAIEAARADKKPLEPLMTRADLWIARYQDVAGRARVLTGQDRKYRWELGPTEHCTTCANLAWQVRRGSFWQSHVLPQNPPNEKLECKGYRCQCRLVETVLEPITQGRLPKTP